MADKTYTNVTLFGRMYTLGGFEDEEYLRRIATVVNSKETELRKMSGFLRQTADYQSMLLALNLADDACKAQDKAARLESRVAELEQEIYSLKHELVSKRMRYDE
ncbi:MAG: cell division protein ZapA [Lachnospiraceae bacterium]|nr:cell division protein ZapA [Lachnospiraceae bacterium]